MVISTLGMVLLYLGNIMKAKKNLFLVLGNQLFDYKYFKNKEADFFMCEDAALCTHFKYHKMKIMHFLCSMREQRDYLRSKKEKVHYQQLDPKISYLAALTQTLKENNYEKIFFFEIEDHFFAHTIKNFFEDQKIPFEELKSPMFIHSRSYFRDYFLEYNKPLMKTFYENSRKTHNILMTEDSKPIGGKFSFDSENRKKIPKKQEVHKRELNHTKPKYFKEIKELIDKYFKDHPGELESYWIPTSRKEAIKLFKHFLKKHIDQFGDYQDALDDRCSFLNHSLISPSLNIGHLTPEEVIREAIKCLKEDHSNLNSIEGFVRQVMGWREFLRGIYQNFDQIQQEKNFFSHKRQLSDLWYSAQTGVEPIDDAIKKAQKYGYCHHIERLMVLSNIMLLLEVDPKQVYKWFMEMFVDSSDWVMGPNVFGMGQFSDGGIFATKPYISGSNYILKMSHYSKKSDWCDAIDGLYWRFIDEKRDFLKGNHRLGMMISSLEKMDIEKKERIFSAANKLQDKLTKVKK